MLGAAPAPAREDHTPILRCLVATTTLGQSKDPAMAQIGIMNSLFWMGRLDQAVGEDEIERRISAIASSFTQADMASELQRCGAELKLRGDMMQRIGQRMIERGARATTR